MSAMCRAMHGEGSLHTLSKGATVSKSPRVYQPGSSLNPGLQVFMEASLHKHD